MATWKASDGTTFEAFADYLRAEFGEAGTFAEKVILEMEKLGADYLVATYTGGNDSGGVDGIRIYSGEIEILAYEEDDLGYPIHRALEAGSLTDISEKMSEEADGEYAHPLWIACDRLLSTEYYSWAGEFTAEGSVFAVRKNRRVWSRGIEQVYADSPRTIDVTLPEPEPEETREVVTSGATLAARVQLGKTQDLFRSAKKIYEDSLAEFVRLSLLDLAATFTGIEGFSFEIGSEYDDERYYDVVRANILWRDDYDQTPEEEEAADIDLEGIRESLDEEILGRLGYSPSVPTLEEMSF